VSFQDCCSSFKGGIVSHQWDFGDGATSTKASPGHIYTKRGVFTVRLRARDAFGFSDVVKRRVKIDPAEPQRISLFLEVDYNANVVAPGAPVHVGDLTSQEAVFAVITFLIISVLMALKKNYAIIAGLFAITITGLLTGNISLPEKLMSIPSDFTGIFWQMDFSGIFTWGFFPVILTVLVMDFVDTMGTLIGVSYKAGFLDENGNLPEIEKPMLTDALSTIIAAVSGTTTAGAFIESAAGVHAGARTGLASVFTALFFLLAIFFAPLLSVFPGYAYGPALVIVGMMMFSSVKDLKLVDISELIPAFTIIILMSFTFNMGIGMTAGFIVYPVMKIITGKAKEVTAAVWILAAVSAVFFVFYPY